MRCIQTLLFILCKWLIRHSVLGIPRIGGRFSCWCTHKILAWWIFFRHILCGVKTMAQPVWNSTINRWTHTHTQRARDLFYNHRFSSFLFSIEKHRFSIRIVTIAMDFNYIPLHFVAHIVIVTMQFFVVVLHALPFVIEIGFNSSTHWHYMLFIVLHVSIQTMCNFLFLMLWAKYGKRLSIQIEGEKYGRCLSIMYLLFFFSFIYAWKKPMHLQRLIRHESKEEKNFHGCRVFWLVSVNFFFLLTSYAYNCTIHLLNRPNSMVNKNTTHNSLLFQQEVQCFIVCDFFFSSSLHFTCIRWWRHSITFSFFFCSSFHFSVI